ncbi:MAG: hypothetical protein ACFB51_03055 [Anaerolineae bacterium]
MTDTFEQVMELARGLSALERVKLAREMMATLETDLQEGARQPKKSLYGLWSGVDVSSEDIEEARREMWGNFPREDI